MALVWFTDKVSTKKVAVNPKYVVAVFVAAEGEMEGTTIISLINGTIPVAESDLEVVTAIGA